MRAKSSKHHSFPVTAMEIASGVVFAFVSCPDSLPVLDTFGLERISIEQFPLGHFRNAIRQENVCRSVVSRFCILCFRRVHSQNQHPAVLTWATIPNDPHKPNRTTRTGQLGSQRTDSARQHDLSINARRHRAILGTKRIWLLERCPVKGKVAKTNSK